MNNIKIYHQCGFRYSWNIDIYKEKGIGDGFILSPKDMEINFLASMDDDVIKKSLFDPQFYALGLMSSQYLSYGFLDFVDNLLDFAKERQEIAKRSIDYQNSIDIKYLTIPTIDFELISSDNSYENVYLELFGVRYDGTGNNIWIF